MIEIVFSQSALGSLKCARCRNDRRNSLFAFSLGLDTGDISEDVPGPARREALHWLCACDAGLHFERLDQSVEEAAASLETVLRRSAEGEAIRIFYSGGPHELCGFYWLLTQLDRLETRGPVSAVELPRYRQRGDLVENTDWGGVLPQEWDSFLSLERFTSPVFFRAAATHWRELQRENAPLRAVVNGRLVSVPEDFYDHFIRLELARTPDEFKEAHLIGTVLGRFQLGIGDGLAANRIEAMIQAGELEAVTQAREGEPSYRRILRKKR